MQRWASLPPTAGANISACSPPPTKSTALRRLVGHQTKRARRLIRPPLNCATMAASSLLGAHCTRQSRTLDVEYEVDDDSCTNLSSTSAAIAAIIMATMHAMTNARMAKGSFGARLGLCHTLYQSRWQPPHTNIMQLAFAALVALRTFLLLSTASLR